MRAIVSPFLLRRTKAQLDLPLPPLHEMVVFAPLSPLQRREYKRTLRSRAAAAAAAAGTAGSGGVTGVNNIVMRLRQLCDHPYLLPGVEPEPYVEGDHLWQASGGCGPPRAP